MPDFNRKAHVLDGEDQRRIECCRCDEYATMCEHSQLYTGSVAFYYYCGICWHTPGPNAPSPAERTGMPAPGVAASVARRIEQVNAAYAAHNEAMGAALTELAKTLGADALKDKP